MNANNSGVQPSASILTRLASKSLQYTACSYVRQKSMVGIVFRAPLFPISDALLQCRPALSIHARSIDAVLRNLLPSTYHWGGGHGWISAASGGLGPFASEPACCPSPSARAGGVRGPRARRPRPPVQSFCTALEMERRSPLSNLAQVLQYPAAAKYTPNAYCSARSDSFTEPSAGSLSTAT